MAARFAPGGAGRRTGRVPRPVSHRPSRNHRRIVRTLGGAASPRATRRRSREITRPGGSPAANAASASRRSAGQAYEPGQSRHAGPCLMRA